MAKTLQTIMLSVENGSGALGLLPDDIKSVARRSKKLITVTKTNGDVLTVDNTDANHAELGKRGWAIGEA